MEMMKTVDVDVPAGVVAGPASCGEGGVDGDGHGSPKNSGVARICSYGGPLSNFFNRYKFNMSIHKDMNCKTQLRKKKEHTKLIK
jgi:hypothetical protein